MRIFASYPNGCLSMKRQGLVWDTLNTLMKRNDLYEDVKEEVSFILDTLKPLPKPNQLRATVKSSTQVLCEWEPVNLKSKLSLNYVLFRGISIHNVIDD